MSWALFKMFEFSSELPGTLQHLGVTNLVLEAPRMPGATSALTLHLTPAQLSTGGS